MPKLTPVNYDPFALPAGYVLDPKPTNASAQLPAGFELDSQPAGQKPYKLVPVDGNPFEQSPPSEPNSWTGDLKAAGTGIARGAEALAGLPGDLQSGVQWLADKVLPTDPKQSAALSALRAKVPGLLRPRRTL